jgi:hypothetical protein
VGKDRQSTISPRLRHATWIEVSHSKVQHVHELSFARKNVGMQHVRGGDFSKTVLIVEEPDRERAIAIRFDMVDADNHGLRQL